MAKRIDPNYDTLEEKRMDLEPPGATAVAEYDQWSPDDFPPSASMHNETADIIPEDATDLPVPLPKKPPEQTFAQDFPRPLARVIDAMFSRGDAVKDILAFVREVRADMARIAYDNAMAAASLELPVIEKSRLVSYPHKDKPAQVTTYKHLDLAEIHRICKPILAKHGLYYSFQVSNDLNAPIKVTCVLSHRDGHRERNTLVGGADSSGQKNSLQAMMSTITYLQRYTLLPLIGGSAGEDDDGRASGNGSAAVGEEYVTPAQGLQLIDEITKKGRSVDKFAQWAKIKDIYHLQASRFEAALATVRSWK